MFKPRACALGNDDAVLLCDAALGDARVLDASVVASCAVAEALCVDVIVLVVGCDVDGEVNKGEVAAGVLEPIAWVRDGSATRKAF